MQLKLMALQVKSFKITLWENRLTQLDVIRDKKFIQTKYSTIIILYLFFVNSFACIKA